MESMSRSSHRRKPSTNSANVFSSTFSFKNPYGGVLLSNGGQGESLQLHEYSEIFAGSSSIPVLDLSGLDEGIGPGDIRSSELDYTNIFGGLTHDEVFVPFEELLNGSAKKAKTRNSTEGRPYLKECGSRHSDQSVDGFKLKESVSLHPSRKMEERPSTVISNQSFDEVSFNTTNQKTSDASDEKTHTAKLNAVPGFTHFVDESRPHKGKNDRPPLLKREVSRTWSFSAEVQPPNTKGGSSVNIKSQSSNTPITSTYPSNIKEPKQSRAFSFASKRDVFHNTAGESSDDFEDNAVDAASASALKKAVEQAQESIRLAKIIMGKKRDGYQDGSKPRPMSSVRVGDREMEVGAFGFDEISSHKKHEELDSLLAGTYRKLILPLSNNGTRVHAETDREHGETFVGGSNLFAPDHIQSKTDENIKVKLEKNVQAAEEQGEAKNINSLLLSAEELTPNVERLETSKESIESRNVYTDGGMEKSLKDDKLCEAKFDHDVSVLNSSHNKIVDEDLKSMRPEDGVNEQRENDMNGKEQQLEAVIIESCNVVTEEEMKKTSEGISERKEDGAKTDDEEINVTESHFRENKEQLKEVVNEVKLDLLPEVGEFENKVYELQINNNKQNCADDPKLPELVQEEHVNTTTMEGGKRETFSEDEKTEDTNTLSGEDYHNGEDIDEPVNLGSNIIAETPESCHVESSSKGEDQRSKGAVDKEKMTEQTFHLQDDEMLGTHYLHRSASEEIFVESKLHEARTNSVYFVDADPEENLSEDEDVSNIDIATDIHAATEIDQGDILGSHARTVELDVEQKAEGDEGSLSTSSCEKIDELLEENVKETTSSKEEVREGLDSEPKEMNKPLEEDKADAPVEERDAKEGQQQRIEAIKRGREREKDRIAVERAIREARERAFAEVRERAAVEKASMLKPASTEEARLRAERSAVERATAEARQRALEKAKSQKISQEWGTPSERHSTRNNVLKHSFSSSDLETGVNSESAQRRKARLERHQRIKERAEKALAEKNMRDLLAQNEQAERNRLAESLDADIKRWATGKEGNLRALLSTLQYILGADSGWQSISLTEIITTAAVKKAYRKATLCVHPDKLQQRGATVHQKYICEKVFDLLKAAWNRFNSDER